MPENMNYDVFERGSDRLTEFVQRFQNVALFSTGATFVEFAEPLYNVSGSTPDPEIDGLSWKQLLLSRGITGNCYADAPDPGTGTSHPGFRVGGHMTPNSDGSVEIGGVCYLMPLCSWHNSTSRDGVPFDHSQTAMLQLSGYMQSEPAAFFLARFGGAASSALIYLSDDGLVHQRLDEPSAAAMNLLSTKLAKHIPPRGVLLVRHLENGQTFYRVEDAQLSD